MKDVEDFNKLRLSVLVTHRMNHQDIAERWARRALLVEEMIKIFKELDIEYRMPPIDVNVRSTQNFKVEEDRFSYLSGFSYAYATTQVNPELV